MIKTNLILLLVFLCGLTSFANEVNVDTLLRSSNNPQFSYSEKVKLAEDIIQSYQSDSAILTKAYSNLGSINLRHSIYKEAIINFEESISIALIINDSSELGTSYYFLGNVYLYLDDLDKANELYQKAKLIFKNTGNLRLLGMLHNSQGILLSKRGNLNSSYQAFFKSYRIFDSLKLDYEKSYPMTNIGDYFLKTEEPDSAIKYFEACIQIEEKFNEQKGKAISLGNIGVARQQQEKYNSAIDYFNKSITIAKKHEFNKVIYDNYKDLSETYKLMNNYKMSLFYSEKYTALKDSIVGSETKKEIALIYTNFENEKKEKKLLVQQNEIAQLESSKKVSQYKIYLIVSCFLLLLITSVFVVFKLRSNLIKQKLEELMVQSKLDFQKNESDRLEHELKNTNQDLTNFALDIARKNEFTISIDSKLKQIKKTTDVSLKERLLQELIFKTNTHLKINSDFELFQNNIEKVNQEFFQSLLKSHPELTTNEVHLCGLIRLGLTIKDIASIKNISPKSVEVNRYRLRKKLSLVEGADLNQFLTTM